MDLKLRLGIAMMGMSEEHFVNKRWLEWTDKQAIPVEVEDVARLSFQGGYIAALQDIADITKDDA